MMTDKFVPMLNSGQVSYRIDIVIANGRRSAATIGEKIVGHATEVHADTLVVASHGLCAPARSCLDTSDTLERLCWLLGWLSVDGRRGAVWRTAKSACVLLQQARKSALSLADAARMRRAQSLGSHAPALLCSTYLAEALAQDMVERAHSALCVRY